MSNAKRTNVQQYYRDLLLAAVVRIPLGRGTADDVAEYAIALAGTECHPPHLVLGITVARASGHLRALEKAGQVTHIGDAPNPRYGRPEPMYAAVAGVRAPIPTPPEECAAASAKEKPAPERARITLSTRALQEFGEILGEMGTKLLDLKQRIDAGQFRE